MPTLTGLPALIKRIQVLATSALAGLSALLAILVGLAQQLEGVAGVPEWLTRILASAIAFIGIVIVQVRGRTPVAAADKGLLPPKGPAAEADPNRDVGLAFIEIAVLIIAVGLVIVAIKVY